MKGLVKFSIGIDNVALQDLPEPIPQEGELKVKVLAAGICGSDIHAIQDERSINMPVTLGHEYVGQVVQTCGQTNAFKVGDWVVTLPACYSCGQCDLCRAGLVTLCKQRRSIGSHINGAMANYIVVPAKYTFHIPNSAVTRHEKILYALSEPMACVVRGVYEKIHVEPGDTVVVSGPGVMGQFASQLFKSRGAFVIVSGLPADRERLDLALSLGADMAVTSVTELRQAVFSRNPAGADITCEATGVLPSLEACVQVIRPMGTHLQLGMFGRAVPVKLDDIFEREVQYVPSNSTAVSTWTLALDLMRQGKVTLQPFLSMQEPLENWKVAFDAAIQKKVYKAVLLPDNSFDIN